jgi:predicted protein tyrosine phosphatase
MKKVLCVCEKGNMRSVACAYLLKKKYGMDALACGVKTSSLDTLIMLCNWADFIFVMSARLLDKIPASIDPAKVRLFDIGTDRWFKGYSADLIDLCDAHIKSFFGTDLEVSKKWTN